MTSKRLLRGLFVVLVAGVSAVLAMIVVTLSSTSQPAAEAPARPAGVPRRGEHVAAARTAAPSSEIATRALPPPSVETPRPDDLDQIPNPVEVDRRYPGLGASYQKAFEAAQARTDGRIQRRCLTALPESVREVRWDTVETFQRSNDGRSLIRTALDVLPGAPDQQPYTDCVKREMATTGELRVEIPEDASIDDTIQVRNAGIVFIGDPTPEDIAEEVASLRKRVADPALTEDQRTAMQDHLDLWDCYQRLGLAHRRECLSR